MIKFFRHIRKSLLMENNTGKYLKYAIGEIILVVIGILIALSINNWNEQKKLQIKEKEVLTEITSDLDANFMELESLLTNKGWEWSLNQTIESLAFLIEYIESDKKYHDSIDIHFNRANTYREVSLKSTGYESLTSIGIDLVLDANLRSKIGEYYSSTILKPKQAYKELRDDYYNYMLSYLRNDFKQTFNKNDNTSIIAPRNYQSLKEKIDYVESLKVYYDVNLFYKNEALSARSESTSLNNKIKSYIESL